MEPDCMMHHGNTFGHCQIPLLLSHVPRYTTQYPSTAVGSGRPQGLKEMTWNVSCIFLQRHHCHRLLICIFITVVYKTLHVAWYEQSSERRIGIRTLLFNRIQDYMGLNKQEHNPRHIISMPNPYKDRTDDLDELEAEQEASEREAE